MDIKFWREWKIEGKISDEPLCTNYRAVNNIGKECIIKYISFSKTDENIQKYIKYGLVRNKNDFERFTEKVILDIKKSIKNMEKCNGRPNIVDCYDYIEVPLANNMGTDFYIQMEYVKNVDEYFKNKEISKEELIKLGIDICKALELCKSINIINANINLNNIFIGKDNRFKLNVFGIDTIFQNNFNLFDYVSPEVYIKKTKNLTSDIYSLGLVLYNLSCRMLNTNKMISNENRLKGYKLPTITNLDVTLMEIIGKSTEFNCLNRYQDPSFMREDLQKLIGEKKENNKKVIIGETNLITRTLDINEAPKLENKNSNIAVEMIRKNKFTFFIKSFFSKNVIAKIVSLVLFFGVIGVFSFNVFYLNKKCDSGFINKNGKCVKGYYYCDDEFVLTEKNQCKKIIHSEPAKATYTCKNGYTLTDFENNKICINNDVRDPKLQFVCPDDFTVNGNKCEKTESVDAKLMYTCSKGYVLVGDKCVDDDSLDATGKYTCPDSSYTLNGNKCTKYTSSSNKAEKKYSCGYGGTLNGTSCEYTTSPQYNYYYPSCSKGTYNRYDGKCHYTESAKVSYYCSVGTSDGYGNCLQSGTTSIDATMEYTCPSGYEVIGNKCAKLNIRPATPVYKCLDSMQLQGTKCYTTISSDAVEAYMCPPGFVASGTKCIKKDFLKPKSKYTCSKVYKLVGEECQKYELKPAKPYYEENK